MTTSAYSLFESARSQGRKYLLPLVDPDKTNDEAAIQLGHTAQELGIPAILIGGSILTDGNLDRCIHSLKTHFAGKVLLFTVSDAEDDIRDALRLDANGYLLKDMEPELLIQYIRDALHGALVISPGLTRVLAQALRSPQPHAAVELTERERQVLKTI
eukprot:gene14224-18162_t